MKSKRILTILTCCAILAGCTSPAPAAPTNTSAQADTGTNAAAADTGTSATTVEPATYDGVTAVLARYPGEGEFADTDAQSFMESEAHWQWWEEYREKAAASIAVQKNMDLYYSAMMRELLVTDETENTVCSPINIYIALAMLAECTDGNTRTQILNVLEVDSIETLRARVQALWEANYIDTPVLTSLLADSVWMRDGVTYNEETLQRLADIYYASSFSGAMGTAEMDKALQDWMNENTGGLLEDAVKEIHTTPETVLALVSTIYYKAGWIDKFHEGATDKQTFHGAAGDSEVDMMHLTDMMSYYAGDKFGAVQLNLTDSGMMSFFLPDEGVDVKDLVTDEQVMQVIRGTYEQVSYPMVRLSVPKFRTEAKTDLMEVMQRLGMTDVMTGGLADFTPLTTDSSLGDFALSSAEHAAVVEVDEEGVTGAAYTIMMVAEGTAEGGDEIDFVLDRPFFFTVTAHDGSILFAGIVQNVL
ncbi:MAG: serpin family protein [Lachnospiraceae bacterium]|nr:serpin family protein [Lachnospiraceae bacterium]